MRRKKALTSSSAIETTQEPSSPKVTCMGQVRVIRSKSKNRSSTSQNPNKNSTQNNNNKKDNKDTSKKSCCYCFRKPGFYRWNLCKPKFPKWVSFFNCRSVKVRTDSSKFGSNRFEQEENSAAVEPDEGRERRKSITIEEITTTMTETTPPPKNALLLTRCRSAPYRSSSLACRFWGSPLRGKSEDTETENRVSGIEVSRDSTLSQSRRDRDNKTERRPSLKKEVEICALVQHQGVTTPPTITDSVNDIFHETLPECKKHDGGVEAAKALMLMRCKSEPARRDSGELDPLSAEFWRHRRSGNIESSTIHSHAAD
uniref:Uncharacterized protein n=2 Tax=Chenopodium quinoa TaxID=63459 RepID=A0A803N3V8_CHEQI